MASAFEAGQARGEARGVAKERLESVRSLCEVLSIEIDEEKERQLSSLQPDQLSLLVQKLKSERRWPENWRG